MYRRRRSHLPIGMCLRAFLFCESEKRGELPAPYLTVTLGMPYRLHTDRDMAVSEPYPGRWTTHFVISSSDQLDDVFFHWLTEAYAFAMEK